MVSVDIKHHVYSYRDCLQILTSVKNAVIASITETAYKILNQVRVINVILVYFDNMQGSC